MEYETILFCKKASLAASLAQTYSGLRRFGDAERLADAAIARTRGTKPRGLLLVKNEAALGMGNVEGAHAALDSIQDNDDMDYQTARLSLYLIDRDYSGAKAFAAKATDEVKRMPDFWLTGSSCSCGRSGKRGASGQCGDHAHGTACARVAAR